MGFPGRTRADDTPQAVPKGLPGRVRWQRDRHVSVGAGKTLGRLGNEGPPALRAPGVPVRSLEQQTNRVDVPNLVCVISAQGATRGSLLTQDIGVHGCTQFAQESSGTGTFSKSRAGAR